MPLGDIMEWLAAIENPLAADMKAALDVSKGFLVALIWLLPYALVAGAVLIIVLLATRKKRRENKVRREQMRQGMNRPMPPQPYGTSPVFPVPPVPPMPPVKPEENKAPSEPPAKA